MARVVVARVASAAHKELDHLVAEAVLDALGELERDPMVGHPLRGRLTGLRSYRVGVYRIIYQLRDESAVRVVAIRHRGDAYTSD
ncbi:MAG TPA: type II toxin-antitoxin system RelE/ParE family toxin, partial [Euzebyales bacterium]|nr:type II toxin-antitoxin system RelE/ParE family toxin [Euzebyales bacterium]